VIVKTVYDNQHPEIVWVLNDLGNAYGELGNNTENIRLGEQALTMGKKIFGKDHPNLTNILNDLSNAYGRKNNYARQKQLLKQALTIQKSVGNDRDPKLCTIHFSLGVTCSILNDYKQQKHHLEQALTIKKALLCDRNPDSELAIILAYLGNAYQGLENYSQALAYYRQAQPILEQTQLTIYTQMVAQWQQTCQLKLLLQTATEHISAGDAKQAITYLELILNQTNSPGVLHNLACCHNVVGNKSKAEHYFKQAINRLPNSAIYCEYAHFLYHQQRYQEAIFQLNIAITWQIHGEGLQYGAMEKKHR